MLILEFRDVHKSYGDVHAVQGVSLTVRRGEVFGLLGPNGAGKTTLIRILMDIIRADSGEVFLFGEPFRRDQLDRVGYLPEERGLYKKQKVLDVLAYFGQLKGLSLAKAKDRAFLWLQKIGLPEVASWKVEQLSKGMGQKVQLAGTLLHGPELCVLDEPFSGLDPVNVRLVRELILEQKEKGRSVILSTHQMNEVETLCDRVGLVHRGKLVVSGTVEEVRQSYSDPEVLVEVRGDLPEVPEVTGRRRLEDGSWRLTLREGVEAPRVLAALVAAGAQVERFEKVLAPMEEVFVRVVGEEEAA